ncbi:MAG: hypothetical protein ABSH19_00250 [Opitutales bacterium]|jgi:hypothetical protein
MTDLISKFLDWLLEKRREEKRLQQQFAAHRNALLYLGLTNNYPVELKKLKDFLIAHDLVERPGVRGFFHKWLTHPVLDLGLPVGNFPPEGQLAALRADLQALHL